MLSTNSKNTTRIRPALRLLGLLGVALWVLSTTFYTIIQFVFLFAIPNVPAIQQAIKSLLY